MRSNYSSAKQTYRRPFLRMMATLLSVVLILSMLGFGTLITTNAWTMSNMNIRGDGPLGSFDDTHNIGGNAVGSEEQYYYDVYLYYAASGGFNFKFQGYDDSATKWFGLYSGDNSCPDYYRGCNMSSDAANIYLGYSWLTNNSSMQKARIYFKNYDNGWVKWENLGALSNMVISYSDAETCNIEDGKAARYQTYDIYHEFTTSNTEGDVSYDINIRDKDNNDVTLAETFSNRYWRPLSTGTHTITLTAHDTGVVIGNNALVDRPTVQRSFTVNVIEGSYYFTSGEIVSNSGDGGWKAIREYKMTGPDNSGNYVIDISLTNTYTFCITTDGEKPVTFKGACGSSSDASYDIAAETTVSGDNIVTWDDATYLSTTKYGRNFKNPTAGLNTYRITFNPSTRSLSIGSALSSGYYLTGTLNGHDIKTRSSNLAFTETSSGSNIYKLSTYFYADYGDDQYVTISEHNGNVYHPVSNNAVSNTAANSTPDNKPEDDPKWKVPAVENRIVTFTWDCRTATKTLSWVIEDAKYVFHYTGRDGSSRSYTVTSDTIPQEAEYNNNGRLNVSNRTDDIISKLSGLNDVLRNSVFNKDISINTEDLDSFGTPDNTSEPYTIKLTLKSAQTTDSKFTLDVYAYSGGILTNVREFKNCAYNTPVDLDGSYILNKPTGHDSEQFIGWYKKANNSETPVGDVISTHPNFGFSVTETMSIMPVFAASVPTTGDFAEQWNAYIDRHEISKEMDTEDTGTIYNDNIVRFRWGPDSAEQFTITSDNQCGILILAQTKAGKTSSGSTFTSYTPSQVQNVLKNMKIKGYTSAKTSSTGIYMYDIAVQSDKLSRLNRVDLVQLLDYARFGGGQYKVMAYVKTGSSYQFSEIISGNY